jgi:hypothetical protein
MVPNYRTRGIYELENMQYEAAYSSYSSRICPYRARKTTKNLRIADLWTEIKCIMAYIPAAKR